MNVNHYNENRGIASPLIDHNDILCGFWMCGNNYRNAAPLYGAYPPCYLKRMKLLFSDEFERGWILHLFSGSIQPEDGTQEMCLDINREYGNQFADRVRSGQHVVGNAESAGSLFLPNFFDLILADPPYDDNHVKYGTEKANKKKVIKECAKIIKVGGYLVWLDTIMPIWAKADGWKLRGTIGLLQSTNHKVRVITILQKVPPR